MHCMHLAGTADPAAGGGAASAPALLRSPVAPTVRLALRHRRTPGAIYPLHVTAPFSESVLLAAAERVPGIAAATIERPGAVATRPGGTAAGAHAGGGDGSATQHAARGGVGVALAWFVAGAACGGAVALALAWLRARRLR